jgi:hypothetical protein
VVGGGSGAAVVGVTVTVTDGVALAVPSGDAVPVAAVELDPGGGVPPGEHDVSSTAASRRGMVADRWRSMGTPRS